MSINRIGNLFPMGLCAEGPLATVADRRAVVRESLPAGERVRVRSGAFEGVEGTIMSYRSPSRLVIEVDLDCQGVFLEIDEHMIEIVPAEDYPRR
ncbi:MAG: hypothetical protein ACREHD_25040 [Pirellulales bacterium]